MLLGAVGLEVVEFPGALGAEADQFVVPAPDRGVALVFEENRRGTGERGPGECGAQAHPFHRLDGFAVEDGRIRRPGEVDAGRHEIDEVAGLLRQRAPPRGGDRGGPVGDERRGDAALVVVVLIPAEGRVLQKRPALADKHGGLRVAGIRTVETTGHTGLRVAPVVGEKQDESVVEFAAFAQSGHEAADRGVHVGEGGGENRHHVIVAVLLPRTEAGPRRDALGAGRERPRGVDEPGGKLPGVAGRAELVPAVSELAAEARDLGGGGLEREVRRVVREIEEERFFRGAGFVDEAQAVVGPEVGGIPFLRHPTLPARADVCAVQEEFGFVASGKIEATGGRVERAVEAAAPRRRAEGLADMPLARHRGEVAGRAEHFGDRDAAVVELPGVAGQHRTRGIAAGCRHVAHAGLMRIEARQERGPRGTAPAGVVELREAHAVFCERIEVRRGDLAAVAAEVGPAHVVDQNDDDVGLGRRRGGGGGNGQGRHGKERDGREKAEATAAHGGIIFCFCPPAGRCPPGRRAASQRDRRAGAVPGKRFPGRPGLASTR